LPLFANGDSKHLDTIGITVLDCRRLLCPLPVMRVHDQVAKMIPGTLLKAVCSDAGALQDIPAWCRLNGHQVLETRSAEHEHVVIVRVGSLPSE